MSFPEFATSRLVLNKIETDDVEALYSLFSSSDVVKFYDLERFHERSQAEKLIQLFHSRYDASLGIRWAIRLKSDGALIGTCGFNSWNEKMRNATLGYDLKPSLWCQGIITEALTAVLRGAFAGVLPCGALHRIQADTIPGNVASEKVLLKLGFVEEGLRRDCAFFKGAFYDMKCFGLLQTEFSAAQ